MVTSDIGNEKNDDAAAGDAGHGLAHNLRQNSLKAAGVGQLIADSALLTYSALTGNMKIGSVGLLGYTAGIIGARYGDPKIEKQLEHIERQLGEHLRQQGVEIPKDPTTESLTKKGGVIDHIESFIYAHPTQLINTCFSLMGMQFARDGMQRQSKSLIVSGGLLMAGGLAGLLIHEKNPDPEHPPEGVFQKSLSWIQEKPLRVTGVLLNLNQVGLAMDALKERDNNPAKKTYIFKLIAVAGFIFGNTMIALSSKSRSGHVIDEETQNKLAETSARIISAQPLEVQTALLNDMANFLSNQPNLHMSVQEINVMLHKKLDAIMQPTPRPAGWREQVSGANDVNSQPLL